MAKEAGSDHQNQIHIRQMEQVSARLPDDDAVAFTLVTADQGPVTLMSPDGQETSLLLFSRPVRAADYLETQLKGVSRVEYLASTLGQAFTMLRDLTTNSTVTGVVVDRCPRCDVAVSCAADSINSADDLVVMLEIAEASHTARADLYVDFAADRLAAGEIAIAMDIVLETVGHVTMEDPRCHLLLGQIGVALDDDRLVREARAFLRFLGMSDWERTLK